ncbi:hypothetical protein NP233_g8286 [Leucocoprinus birnbaumii]|uniref:Uncharacterized protein n=1 Tax=Leucocoprinus birnbaumii TaxID=56174 RepID=A0AAD5YTZ4_9AGAR|nr:hypothetical protein NP233_g8286 [Leucocoprinus birnbaumii]
MSHNKENLPPLRILADVASGISSEEEDVSRSLRVESYGSPASAGSNDLYYIPLIAYIESGQRAVEIDIDVDEDHSISLHRDNKFLEQTNFPHESYFLFDIDEGDWVNLSRRSKIDLSNDIRPHYPFFLVKRKGLIDDDCPMMEHHIQRLGGRRSPDPVKSEGSLSPLPSSLPLAPMTSPPLPMTSPLPVLPSPEPMATPPPADARRLPQPCSHLQGNIPLEDDKLSEYLKDFSPVINFKIKTVNMKISVNDCGHKRPYMKGGNNAHETSLMDELEKEQFEAEPPRKKARLD